MSGNKASYYRIPTKSELDNARTPRGSSEVTGTLTEDAVYRAMQEVAKTHPNFNQLSTTAALNLVEAKLEDRGWKDISTSGNTISGPGGARFYVRKARNNNGFVLRNKG